VATDQEVLDAVLADPSALSLMTAGRDAECAARVSALLPPVPANGLVNERAIVYAFSQTPGSTADDGAAAVFAFRAASESQTAPPSLKLVASWLSPQSGGIDFSLQSVKDAIDGLVASAVLTATQGDVLKSLGVKPDSVSADQVSRAFSASRWQALGQG
jgi:hypothetical protein